MKQTLLVGAIIAICIVAGVAAGVVSYGLGGCREVCEIGLD